MIDMLYYYLCMKGYKKELEISQTQITLSAFLESYNQSIPESFPRASVVLLKKFQDTHQMLFKNGDMWSVSQHRKKLMDWLPSYRDA